MALWTNTDGEAGKPKYLSNADKAKTFGMDTTEITAGGDNVTSVALVYAGARYKEGQFVTFSGGGGSNAAAGTTGSGNEITSIVVTNVGSGYTSAPTVVVPLPSRTIATSFVNIALEQLSYPNHGLVAGESVKYFHGGGTGATGLTNNTEYFVSALGLAPNTFRLATTAEAAAGRAHLTTVAIAGTGGEFTCAATTLAVGERIRFTGTLTGTGTITGYTTGKVYAVSAITGTAPNVTGFTITEDDGTAVVSTAGTTVGLSFITFNIVLLSGTGNNAQYIELQDEASRATAVASLGYTSAGSSATHTGWVLRNVGTGGRAGRVQSETLVAMGSMTSDASDDTVLPDA